MAESPLARAWREGYEARLKYDEHDRTYRIAFGVPNPYAEPAPESPGSGTDD